MRMLGRFAVRWMNEDDRLAPVELIEDWIELLIAQVAIAHAGKNANTVQMQDVERVGQFLQRMVDIGKWQQRESAESGGMLKRSSCLELVAVAGHGG